MSRSTVRTAAAATPGVVPVASATTLIPVASFPTVWPRYPSSRM